MTKERTNEPPGLFKFTRRQWILVGGRSIRQAPSARRDLDQVGVASIFGRVLFLCFWTLLVTILLIAWRDSRDTAWNGMEGNDLCRAVLGDGGSMLSWNSSPYD